MTEDENKKVNESLKFGAENFTEKDLDKVMSDSATAEKKSANLGKQFENFKLLWQLLKDYYKGEYKHAPWKFIASIGFAVAYLVSPIDIIPDFLPIIGFVDDAAVFALVVSAFQSDIDAYKEYLLTKKNDNTKEVK